MTAKILKALLLSYTLIVCCANVSLGQHKNAGASSARTGEARPATRTLQAVVDEAARVTLERFADKKLKAENLAITLIDLRDAQHPTSANFRGDEKIYPASVVKLFYLVAAHRWLEDGKLKETDELQRAMRDMIVESSNDATHYVLDALTDTTSGLELSPAEMGEWATRRNSVNRYFATLGYKDINANQKPWCEGPYGRDKVFLGEKYENRNKLTTNATARLLSEIVTGRAVNAARSAKMMELLKRDYSGKSDDADDQAHGFTSLALAPGARLWSKAGWTSTTRHDAAYVELPDGSRFVLVTFTTDHANDREIIPTVARSVMAGLSALK
jgi:beta-lactamase class A